MNQEDILPVNLATAKLFVTQCIGGYSGHMAEIAFSPTIRAIIECHGINTTAWDYQDTHNDFATFLRMVADQLSPERP